MTGSGIVATARRSVVLGGGRWMTAKRFPLFLVCLFTTAMASTFGALVSATPAAAASPATWSVVSTANLNSTGNNLDINALSGISWISAWACTAVGSYGQDNSLVEQWNGTSWSVVPSPNPTVS